MHDLILFVGWDLFTAWKILEPGKAGELPAEYRLVEIHGLFGITHEVEIDIDRMHN